MTTFLLVRHAAHDLLGRVLAGRMSGVHLNAAGRAQAIALAERLGTRGIAAVQASPMERAQQTAEPLALGLGLPTDTVAALDEIDFGRWQGKSFAALAADPDWQIWNARRADAHVPGGESMREVQARIVGHIERMSAHFPERTLVLVSHGDVIKAALLHIIGAPLGAAQQIEIAPASISTVLFDSSGARVVSMNEGVMP